ncbi:52 kDa repressor of the inhibitor of the protein kinase-like [Diadema antillarum]|uniref:52 kDa repressor of the inhibitor of the protein kinase-like n=1 Tax=Diadema antillarum TaxID=105358 RepID=UPI003A8A6AF8
MNSHAKCTYHIAAMQESKAFVTRMKNPERTIPYQVNANLARRLEENKQILHHIVDAVLFCAMQNIGLRGRYENLQQQNNPGNFVAYLWRRAKQDNLLKKHLMARTNTSRYTSPLSQNELISAIASFITEDLVHEIQEAKFYCVMADEVTSHNKEIMALCIRFVDKERNIREEFLSFQFLERIRGQDIGRAIVDTLCSLQIPITDMRAQCFDGAANMSSDRCGAQSYVRSQGADLAPYAHCSSHALNLVIAHSCRDTEVKHVIDQMKAICLYFNGSPKRQRLLECIVNKGCTPGKRKPLLDLCRTRWAERQAAYDHFYTSYVFMVEALEHIAHGLHTDKYELQDFSGSWSAACRSDANSLCHSIASFKFVTVFMVVYQGLGALAEISKALQKRALDVYDAYTKVDGVVADYKELRENIDARFKNCGDAQACRKTTQRPNAQITSCSCEEGTCDHRVETYFRVNYAVPFVDHIIAELEKQFSALSKRASRLLGLVPEVALQYDCDIDSLIATYSDDLPSPGLVQEEYERWRAGFRNHPNPPDSPARAIKACDRLRYPNIFVLLKVACTLPVTSAECERSASVLRRLHHYTRATMGMERLSALALIHIHYDYPHDVDKIISRFAKLHPRKMALPNLVYGDE